MRPPLPSFALACLLLGAFIASPILITDDVRVIDVGILSAADSVRGLAVVGIYEDSANQLGQHRPGRRLDVSSYSKPIAAGGMTTLFPPENSNLLLHANTLYWVAALFNAGFGESIRLLEYQAIPQANGTGAYLVGSANWSGGLPNAFPVAGYYGGVEASFFMDVQRYWN